MELTIIGMGPGNGAMMIPGAREALTEADLIVGARRLLEGLSQGCTSSCRAAVRAEDIIDIIHASDCKRPCAVFSGDTGFYSGAKRLLEMWDGEYRILPGIGSVSLFAARLGLPWQGWKLVSAHGRNCDPAAALCSAPEVFFLTGGEGGAGDLCTRLVQAGMGNISITVGENLSYPEERILKGTAQEFAGRVFGALTVLLVRRQDFPVRRAPGLPDGQFIRGRVPMTKQEVRAAALAKLGVLETDIVYDVGAGTGSVSVELAMMARAGHVYAVERDAEGCALIRANREKHGAWNLTLVEGTAPEALEGLPAADAAFIGGSGGCLREILKLLKARNTAVRVVVSAITLETLEAAVKAMEELGYGEPEVTQIAVSRTMKAGSYHMLQAQNPVFLISGGTL